MNVACTKALQVVSKNTKGLYNGLNNKGLYCHKTYRSTLQPLRKQMEQSKPPRESSHCKPLM